MDFHLSAIGALEHVGCAVGTLRDRARLHAAFGGVGIAAAVITASSEECHHRYTTE